MTPLDTLLHRLYERGELFVTKETGNIHSYSYTYMGRLAHQRVVINPSMPKAQLFKIVGRAMAGSLSDIATVSMMYNVGYGLPKDALLSEVWAQFATISPAVMDFEESVKILKADYRTCSEIVWPAALVAPVERIAGSLGRLKPFANKMSDVSIAPIVAGIRVLFVYRKVEEGAPQLYAAYYLDNGSPVLELDALIKLGAPAHLDGTPNNKAVDSFVPFGKAKLTVVVGTIAIPTKLHKKARQFGKTTKDVFKALLADMSTRKTLAAFDNSFYVEQLQTFGRRIRRYEVKLKTVKGLRRVNLKAEYETAVTHHATLKAALEKSNPETDYANYLDTLPETYLRLVTTGHYEWKRGEMFVTKLAATTPSKRLAAHGLTELVSSGLSFAEYGTQKRVGEERLRKLTDEFEEALGFKVTGLIVQPSETPQFKSCRIFIK